MHLRRAFCLVAMLLFLVVPCVFAQSLLQRSLSSANEDELRAMAQSLGLDSTGNADDLLLGISEYFGVSMEPDGSGSASIQSEAFGTGAVSSTSISIEHSDTMFSFGDIVVLSGDVAISFSDSSNGKKVMTADKVVIDVSLRAVEASGNVVLEDLGDASKRFEGGSVLFNWENMDIVVFNGISSTERKNAAGSKVSLYASGRTISYDGEQSIVFFDDGVVATAQDDPYWSIEASKVSFSGSDVFIDGALFKLGRVPILYFPFFFYPGTTLAFNPAIGLSSDKGRFINTTTELYGVYPKIGASSNSSSSSKDDSDSDLSASILSLLDSGDSSEKVRDGLFYRTLDDGEQLGALESWARSSKSYFAFFADAYEDIGLVAGYDTSNSLWDGLLSIGSTAAIAYNVSDSRRYESPTRYYVDFNLKLKYKDVSLSISAPAFSDYLAKSDLLNRNTTFGLDSVFGSSQEFPSTYSSQKQYSWTVDASASAKLGQVNLRLSSLAAKIDFELDDSKSNDGKYSYEPKVKGASLPDLSFSSDASWTIAGGSSSKSSGSDSDTGVQSVLQYDNALAESFEEERTALLQSDLDDEDEVVQDAGASEELIVSNDIQEDLDVQDQQDVQDSQDEVPSKDIDSTAPQRPAFYEAPSLAVSTKSSVSNGSIKVGYTFNQVFRNKYADDLVPSSLYSKTSGSFYVNGTAPDSWFVVKETLKPQYSFSMDATQKSGGDLSYKSSHDVSFVSNLEVQSNPIGLTYRLSNKVYSLVSKDVDGVVSQSTSQWGEWNSKDVTEHSIEFKKSLGSFSFGIKGTLKPVKETIKPSVSFSSNGFTGSLDMTFDEKDGVFGKSLGNLGLGYSNSFMSLSLKNAYDFRKYDGVDILSGYSFVQSGSLKLLSGALTLSESVGYKEGLMPSSMSFSVRNTLDFTAFVSNGTYSISFKGDDKAWNLDVLKVRISNSLKPIYFWRNRIGLELSLDADFTYSFANPYASSLTFDFKAEFAVAEFLSLKIGVRSANRSFYRYFVDGAFSFNSMLEDLARSFDFFGDGRTSTGFNMSSLSVEFVHYMRDWDLCMSIEGSLKAQRSGRYAWSPVYKVYVKWNAIPELKVERTVDRSKEV